MSEKQNSEDGCTLDLFGNPVVPIRNRRGRPSFAKTKENQQFVALRAAAGWTHERIAEDMGIDDDTLRKHFSGELKNGRIYIEGMMLDVLALKMQQGHVPSMRLLKEVIDVQPDRTAKPNAKQPKAPPLGKKDLLNAEARTPTLGWGDVLPN